MVRAQEHSEAGRGEIISVRGVFKFWTRESFPEKSMLESRQRSRGSYEDTGYELSRVRDQCKGPEACVVGNIWLTGSTLHPHPKLLSLANNPITRDKGARVWKILKCSSFVMNPAIKLHIKWKRPRPPRASVQVSYDAFGTRQAPS